MHTKRLISIMLLFVMLFTSLMPIATFAQTVPTITVASVTDAPGSSISVPITIKDNPGIAGATLKLTFGDGLTLTEATLGDALSSLSYTEPGSYGSPCNLTWWAARADSTNGTMITLHFTIDENAPSGSEYDIKLSYGEEDVVDGNLDYISPIVVNGKVSVVDYIPGDLDGNGKVQIRDAILLSRHIAGGYEQTINESAADVNADSKITIMDAILISRYIAGGYDVVLKPSKPKCNHTMDGFPYKAPTCTEDGNIAYWYCTTCKKYFADANGTSSISLANTVLSSPGHTIEVLEAVPPTYDSPGLTEGKHCSVCNEVMVEQDEIPPLKREEYSITYYIDRDDEYLKSLNIENPNPSVYSKEDGLVLEDLIVDGYNFVGWYTAQTGGERVSKIHAGETGNRTLYARWEKVIFYITFHSPILEKASIPRTIDEEISITDLELHKYKFMGWTDANGNLVTTVKPGTGDIKLYANWVSYRNQTISNDYKNDEPIIIEDEENQQYFFVYYIGKMVNVPLYTIKDFGNTTSGIIRHESISKTSSISTTTASNITKSVVDCTTNSATWTLSKDWNKLVTNTEDFSEVNLEESNILISDGRTSSSNTTENTGTVTDTGTLTKDNTTTKDLTTTTKGNSAELGAEIAISKKSWPISAKISGKYEQHKDKTDEDGTITDSGTDEYNLTHTNNLKSSSSSSANSHNETVSDTISKSTQKNWGFSISDSVGGGESSSETTESTLSNSNSYSTSFSYNTTEATTTVKEFTTEDAVPGWHRLVCAGTVHVFAVVGYDIPTRTYYNYSFSALDDEKYEFYDYSAHNGEYNDYETGVLPFEVPIDVHHYVTERAYRTKGLTIDADTGIITRYTGEDTYVNIPDYYCLDNGDGTYSAVKITGIASNAFSGKTHINEIRLSNFITTIPDNAFKGCTALEKVTGENITTIGSKAFSGCVNLKGYTVPKTVEYLGANAFENVPEVIIIASDAENAKSAADSGAKRIVLDISAIAEADIESLKLEVGKIELFELQGKDKEYKALSLKSAAETTVVNGVTFTQNVYTPMEFSSSNVTLNRVTVDCKGFALMLLAEETNLILNRTINLTSSTGNAIITKGSITVSSLDSGVLGSLNVTGSMIVCGELNDDDEAIEVSNGDIKYITTGEFENYIKPRRVTFDANGGILGADMDYKMVPYNSLMGDLPVVSRDYYTFVGWYTAAEGGEAITSETVMNYFADITVYAHWVQNDVSSWTLKSEVPADAEIVDNKFVYTLKSYKKGVSSSSLSGWTQYNSSCSWSSYGNWSSWGTNSVSKTDSRDVQTRTTYRYHRYTCNDCGDHHPFTGECVRGSFSVGNYKHPHTCGNEGEHTQTVLSNAYSEIWITTPHWTDGKYASDSNWRCVLIDGYGSSSSKDYTKVWWWYNSNGKGPSRTEYRYRDRYQIWTYDYYKTETLESKTYPIASGDSEILNCQEYVQYRTK